MKKCLLLIMILAKCLSVHAQEENLRIHTIRFQPLQLLVRELSMEYELPLLKNVRIGIGTAYRFPQKGEGLGLFANLYAQFLPYERLTAINPFYAGYKFNISPKVFLNTEHNWYFSSEMFYRKWWKNADQKHLFNRDEEMVIDGNRKEEIDVLGVKLLVGYSDFLFSISENSEVSFSVFTGFGYRIKSIRYEKNNVQVNNTLVPIKREFINFQPFSFHLGVLVGIGFVTGLKSKTQ